MLKGLQNLNLTNSPSEGTKSQPFLVMKGESKQRSMTVSPLQKPAYNVNNSSDLLQSINLSTPPPSYHSHLSDLSVSNSGSIKLKNSKKKKNLNIFEASLEEIMEFQCDIYPRLFIPCFLNYLIEELYRFESHSTVGIFRISIATNALTSHVETIVKTKTYGSYSIKAKDPHTYAAILKFWLRNLPVPLFPDYETCIKAADDPNNICKKKFLFFSYFLHFFFFHDSSLSPNNERFTSCS